MIVIMNGPPGSGKDTITNLLLDKHTAHFSHWEFKRPMWDIARATLGYKYYTFKMLYDDRLFKEKPVTFLSGLTPREFFIHISESWCKPLFGEKYFGERAFAYVKGRPDNIIFSDGGFPLELFPMLEGGMKVLVVRLHRKNHTFSGDSRNYLYAEQFEELPHCSRPTFLDVEVVEGHPQDAANVISLYTIGK